MITRRIFIKLLGVLPFIKVIEPPVLKEHTWVMVGSFLGDGNVVHLRGLDRVPDVITMYEEKEDLSMGTQIHAVNRDGIYEHCVLDENGIMTSGRGMFCWTEHDKTLVCRNSAPKGSTMMWKVEGWYYS